MPYLPHRKDRPINSGIIKIILIYIIVGGLWILFSDSILPHFTNNIELITYIATAKGLLYVLVTACLLYILIHNYANEIKQVEENFHESEKRYKELANSLPQMVFEVNNEGLIKFTNLASYKMFGYTQDEIATGFSVFDAIVPEDRERARRNMIQIMRGKNQDAEEYSALRKDGTTFPVIIFSSPITTNNQTTGLRGIAIDITERKIMEDQLIMAKEKAEESDKLKSEFLAQMSHEIRTPLNVILSYNSFLKDELANYLNEEQVSGFNSVATAGRRLIRTIDLILNMAELHAGKLDVRINEINIYSILIDLTNEFEHSAKEKNLVLTCTNNCGVIPIIKSDGYIVTEVFQNLIDNAVKYTLKGKIEINIYKEETDRYCVAIKDTGIGIGSEYQDKIFLPFVQEDSGYSRKFDGNGLGLALVKKYLELINAEITVESEKGKGSLFVVRFN
jgi:PAS domain S-box-containing protein